MTERTPSATPRRSPLRLRRAPDIALAFVLGPAAGLTVLWVLMLLYAIFDPGRGLYRLELLTFAFAYAYMVFFGVIVCLVVELALITPLLAGFRRHHWRWLNGWTGALIGFALAFVPALLIGALGGPADQTVWGATAVAGGRRTAAGWAWLLVGAAAVGSVGLTAAGVFRLLAVRTAAEGEP